MKRMLFVLAIIGCVLLVGVWAVTSCSFMTDAATRLGYDVVRNAEILRSDADAERTFVHHPSASPEGCEGAYTVTFDESLHHPASGGGLVVNCKSGVYCSTTYHLNAVRVPVALSVEKQAGADMSITLRKNGDAIDVVHLE